MKKVEICPSCSNPVKVNAPRICEEKSNHVPGGKPVSGELRKELIDYFQARLQRIEADRRHIVEILEKLK